MFFFWACCIPNVLQHVWLPPMITTVFSLAAHFTPPVQLYLNRSFQQLMAKDSAYFCSSHFLSACPLHTSSRTSRKFTLGTKQVGTVGRSFLWWQMAALCLWKSKFCSSPYQPVLCVWSPARCSVKALHVTYLICSWMFFTDTVGFLFTFEIRKEFFQRDHSLSELHLPYSYIYIYI